MALETRITVKNTGKILDNLKRIRANVGKFEDTAGYEIARTFAKSIRSSAKFIAPRGSLKKSIVATKRPQKMGEKKSWFVRMAPYGWYVEFGRKPGKRPPDTEKLRRWARQMLGGNIYQLRRIIGRRGTRPRPFIRPGIARARPQVNEIIRKHMKILSR